MLLIVKGEGFTSPFFHKKCRGITVGTSCYIVPFEYYQTCTLFVIIQQFIE